MALAIRRAPSPTPRFQRYDPLSEIEELQQQLGTIMQDALSVPVPGDGQSRWTPLADIEETEDAWILEAEIPGVKRGDVNLEVRDSEVIVSGEIKERERKGILRRRTRPVGQFEYRVTLPGDIDSESVEASVSDGVLTVRIPKSDRTQSRTIEVGQG
jgi:HSP20 family protein